MPPSLPVEEGGGEKEPKGNFCVYLSSAGSGKTFTLTRNYVKLALSEPPEARAFAHIVALTFTNKATEEMRARILKYLQALAVNDRAEVEALGLSTELQLSEEALQARAAETLRYILHDYTQFAVSTIDVFFQRIVSAFLLEVGLPGYYRLELDTKEALRSTADLLIQQAGDDQLLTSWLMRFLDEQLEEEKSWDIVAQLAEDGKQMFKEHFLALFAEQSPLVTETTDQPHISELLKRISALLQGMDQQRKAYEQKLQEKASGANQLLHRYGLSVDDLKYKKGGPYGLFERIGRNIFSKEALCTYRVQSASEALENNDLSPWISQQSQKKEEIETALEGGLSDCFSETLGLLEEGDTFYASLVAVRPHMYFLGLISYMQAQVRGYRDQEGLVFLSDINQILRQLTKESYTPYIYEKVGSYYRHYLLDEFQDTSLFQWESLSPLLREGLDQGYSQLLVGDLKQSIYRWRGASPIALFEAVQRDIPTYAYKEVRLSQNWRSSPVLVEINNALFKAALLHLSNLFRDSWPSGHSPLELAYEDIELHAQKNLPGYATYTAACLPKKNKQGRNEGAERWLSAQLDDLFKRGYQPQHICVLIRTHREEEKVVECLLKHSSTQADPYTVYSQMSMRLSNARSVGLLIAALSLISEQLSASYTSEMKLLWVQIYTHYEALRSSDPLTHQTLDEFWKKLQSDQLQGPIAQLRHTLGALRRLPLYMLSERLIHLFELYSYEEERPFLDDFMSLVFNYQQKNNQSLPSFLSYWEGVREKASLSTPPHGQSIQVMTLHKAKGLEFPVVLLPFCSWSLDHPAKPATYLWESAPQEGFFSDFPFLFLRYSKKLLQTNFKDSYTRERISTYLDSLNLLYVACTRSVYELHLCYGIEESHFKSADQIADPSDVGELLHSLLFREDTLLLDGLERRLSEEQSVCYYGTKELYAASEPAAPPPSVEAPLVAHRSEERLLDRSDWNEYILIGSGSEENRRAQIRGKLLHQLLASVDHINDLEPLLRKLSDSPDEQWVADRLRSLFDLPQIQSWFSGNWQLKHEHNILTADGNWCRPDLILLKETEIQIVDFKSTRHKEESHIQQLSRYTDIVSQLCMQDISGFLAYVDPPQVVRIR